MKITLAQLNYTIGDFGGNTRKIIEAIRGAALRGNDLVVFSELSVCGYPPLDLLEYEYFINECNASVKKIADVCTDIAAIVGAPVVNTNPHGKNLFNSALFLNKGRVEKIVHKTLLPTYDIFDEYRYFEPNTQFEVFSFKGTRIALTICEDLWYEQPLLNGFGKERLYTVSPLRQLAALNPNLVINISASPFSWKQVHIKKGILTSNASNVKLPLVYVNQVGAHSDLIFDGASLVMNSRGEALRHLPAFEEGVLDIDTALFDEPAPSLIKEPPSDIANIYNALVLGIRDYFAKSGIVTAILGLSGGIDSAVTLALAASALGAGKVRALLLPSRYSSGHSVSDAEALCKNLGTPYDIIPIEPIFNQFEQTLAPLFASLPPGLAEENIQARIRGNLLMALSNKFGPMLLNTSNKSETAVGYGTLYGDMSGGLSVLGDVYKTDVYRLARYINRNNKVIPEDSITKPPSAELRPGQKDSDSLPAYDILDKILYQYIELRHHPDRIIADGLQHDVVMRVVKLVNANEYKRYQTPPILRISFKAFGMGRRMPLVARYG